VERFLILPMVRPAIVELSESNHSLTLVRRLPGTVAGRDIQTSLSI
jgi:hypothetical protein